MSVTRFLPVCALIGAFAGPLAAGAQTPPPPAPVSSAAPKAGSHHGHHHHQSLIHALHSVNLTAAQKQQIATFRQQEKQANLNADPATKKANAGKLRDQIQGILTPDQKTQLSSAMHRSHTHGPGAAPSPAMSPGSK